MVAINYLVEGKPIDLASAKLIAQEIYQIIKKAEDILSREAYPLLFSIGILRFSYVIICYNEGIFLKF